MKATIAITVERDDGTRLTRSETVATSSGYGFAANRKTIPEVRKDLDSKVKTALNQMGVK
jgi:hypothetical protein